MRMYFFRLVYLGILFLNCNYAVKNQEMIFDDSSLFMIKNLDLKKIYVSRVDSIEHIEGRNKDFMVKLSSNEFKIALIESLKNANLYDDFMNNVIKLEARIMSVKLNSTVLVFDSESEVSLIYSLYDNKKLFKEFEINTYGKVKMNEEFVTYNRMRKAIEIALRKNIQEFLQIYAKKNEFN